MRTSVSQEVLIVKPLLLHSERSNLRWFSYQEEAPGQKKGSWRDYVCQLDQLEEVASVREDW